MEHLLINNNRHTYLTAQHPPPKVPRHEYYSSSSWRSADRNVQQMQAPTLTQDSHRHEIGAGSPLMSLGNGPVPQCCCFTYSQLQELQQQLTIYNHMQSGVSLPSGVVYPIWRSVVAASSPSSRQHIPTIYFEDGTVFQSNQLYVNQTDRVNLEPGRCRRTDGKKWRCSRRVIQNKKYCERHLQRGRLRRQGARKVSEEDGADCTFNLTMSLLPPTGANH